MKIQKRKLVYLTTETEGWAEPIENNCTYVEILTHLNGGKRIEAKLSCQIFPKALLEFELAQMTGRLGIPFLNNCVIGRWGFKKALSLRMF